jgi:hypothetical protein
LDEEFDTAVIGFFLFSGEVASGKFTALPVVMETLATQRMFVAGESAGAIGSVDFDPGTLVLFSHS